MDPTGYDLASFKEIYTRWDEAIIGDSRGTIFLGNHDQPRMVSRWGNDSPEFRQLSSTLLTTFLLTMRATPFYYAGDELGMNNIKFDSIEDYRDLETLNMYEKLERLGGDTNAFIQSQKNSGRDNSRTPFQWSGDLYAGFSDVAPWLKVNENFFQVNVLNQDHDPASPLNYFRSLIKVRKENLGLIYGTYQLLDVGNDLVYAYTRQLSDKKYLILLNFSSLEALIQLPDKFLNAVCLLGNYSAEIYKNNLSLRPYEAVISLIV
jgi:oligo-1,6-glucosidase